MALDGVSITQLLADESSAIDVQRKRSWSSLRSLRLRAFAVNPFVRLHANAD
jgi:hypothetical protein